MNPVSLEQKKYYGWNGYSLTNGEIELGIAPEIGGRIISLQVQGEELLYVDQSRLGETFDLGYLDNLSRDKTAFGFRLWGGDKTWVAPEKNWIAGIPPLHLDAGKYEAVIQGHSIRMTSPVDQETGLQIIRSVSMSEDGTVLLNQHFFNRGKHAISCGIWDVTQLLHPFHVYFPVSIKDLKPDMRFIASVREKDTLIQQQGDWVKIRCEKPLQFKYGCHIYPGVAMALREQANHTIVMARYFFIDPQAKYPHDDMVEVYNSDHYPYLELEILAPLIPLNPGDQTTHQQQWQIKKYNGKVNIPAILEALTHGTLP